MTYILHNYRRCPFCIRVRIMLYLKGIEYEVVEEPLRIWTAWMKAWGTQTKEKLRVPVLRSQKDSGEEQIFVESNEINRMLDQQHGEPQYTPILDSLAHQEMEEWLAWCDDIFKHQIDRFKYGENQKFDALTNREDTKVLRDMVAKLEKALLSKQYLVEGRLTLADIAIIPFVRQIMRTRSGEFDFTDFPRTEAWALAMMETDWFTNIVMKKYPLALS